MAAKRPSAKAIILTLAVFILGGAVGVLGTYVAGHMRDGHRRQRIVDRLNQQLQLTPEQQKQIESILEDGHKRITVIYRESQDQARPQYDAVHNEIRSRIRAVLTPAQQPRFDEFLKRLDAERKAREQQAQPPPHPSR
ncbi:MAG: periplasmic heavy metal sensor [Acidobacteriota bacterium]|nr:periplasmic heavy metal sensor [Acidobacteriota bacterium]